MLSCLVLFLSLFSNLFADNAQNLSVLTSSLTSLAEPRLRLIGENNAAPHLSTEYQLGNYKIVLIIQDILQQPADAIVNAANTGCLRGGGIDGVISSRGGQNKTQSDQYTTLYDLRVAIPQIAGERCPRSQGRITRGGWLQYPYDDPKVENHDPRKQFNYVVHAVGPSCDGAITEVEKRALANTYVHTLERVDAFNKNPKDTHYLEFAKIDTSDLGENYQIKSLNFPTISTGIFGCTADATADFVVAAVYDLLKKKPNLAIKQINFVFWDPTNPKKAKADYDFYKSAFSKKLTE